MVEHIHSAAGHTRSMGSVMSDTTIREFDLSIEKMLEGWEVRHALRKMIANALDEQTLTDTKCLIRSRVRPLLGRLEE